MKLNNYTQIKFAYILKITVFFISLVVSNLSLTIAYTSERIQSFWQLDLDAALPLFHNIVTVPNA